MDTRIADALPLKQRSLPRRFVAMDIENVNGGAVLDKRLAQTAFAEVANVIALRDHEQVVVGVGKSSVVAVGLSLPTVRRVMGTGLDGADKALIEVLVEENLPERFDDIVIVSGDGIFAEPAAWLASQGVGVTVVARERQLSRRLRLAASIVLLLADRAPTRDRAA